MFKWIFTAVFVIFAGIRLHYGKTDELRTQFHHPRELFSSGLFTVSLLGTTALFLFSNTIDEFGVELPTWIRWLGAVCALAGNGMLLWVHRCLGANFSPHLELREGHTLVVNGPYRILRHPMYTSGLMYLIGCGLLSSNSLVFSLPVGTFVVLIALRLKDEEQMLSERFADAWVEHELRTFKIVPYLY